MEYRVRVLEVSGLQDFLHSYPDWRTRDAPMHASMLPSYGCYVEAALYHGYDPLNAGVPPSATSVQMGGNSVRCGE